MLLLPSKLFAEKTNNDRTLTLLGNENLSPIVYNDNGTAKGVAVDIAKAIGDSVGYDIHVMPVNWEKAQLMLLNGDADGLLHINPSTERNKLYDFSKPLLKSDFSIFVQSNNATLRRLDDLHGRNVGIEVGGYASTLLDDFKDINLEIIYNWEASFEDLSSGNLDAIIVDRWIGEYELAQSRISGIKVVEEPIESQYSRIAVRKGDDETLALINSGLTSIVEDGTLDKILDQWQDQRVLYLTKENYQNFFLHFTILLLFLVALIALFFLRRYQKLSKKLKASVKERTEKLHQANKKLKATNLKLEHMSMIDSLTSIENRRAFNIEYSKAWKASVQDETPLALIMIDIDHFKIFNDTYGHLTGDQALMKIAEEIKNVADSSGHLAARYGGEEFVVMIKNDTAERPERVAEEIRAKIEGLAIENETTKSVITVSLGIASFVPDDEMAPDELIEAADRALYEAKEAGRNRMIIWNNRQE